jgi:hypothetical protein
VAAVTGWALGGLYLLVPAGVLVGAGVAVAAHLAIGAGRRPPRAVAFARSFAVVNLAFALGWINVLRGRGIEIWHGAEWRARG